jgi:release factor glutamine methyltransferase
MAFGGAAMKLGAALDDAAARLAAAGVEAPRREARLLAAHALGVPSSRLLDSGLQVDAGVLDPLVARRVQREPLALIVGRRGFWTLDFAVSAETLVPRADSETLIEAALAACPDRGAVRSVLDLGTGTGCLLLAALSEFGGAFGVGVDIAPGAVGLAARNAAALGLAHRAAFYAGDWAQALSGRFDLVLCNPPYIPTGDLAGLMPEVRLHEPVRALDGGVDGLYDYARLAQALPLLLSAGGVAILELGIGQAEAVMALAEAAGFAHIMLTPDLGGIPRALTLRRGGAG